LPPDLIFQRYNAPNSILAAASLQIPLGEPTALPQPTSWILAILFLKGRGK